jgi:hypothetical protein
MRKLSLRHFNGYFLVTGPDTEPAKFKTRQQALTWCAAHYPDLPIKEDRPKRPAKTPRAPGSGQLTGAGES